MCLLKILMFSSIHLRDGEEYKTLISFCDYSVLCRQRQAEGIVCAKARGVYKGRRKTIDEDCMRASLVSQPSLVLQCEDIPSKLVDHFQGQLQRVLASSSAIRAT